MMPKIKISLIESHEKPRFFLRVWSDMYIFVKCYHDVEELLTLAGESLI